MFLFRCPQANGNDSFFFYDGVPPFSTRPTRERFCLGKLGTKSPFIRPGKRLRLLWSGLKSKAFCAGSPGGGRRKRLFAIEIGPGVYPLIIKSVVGEAPPRGRSRNRTEPRGNGIRQPFCRTQGSIAATGDPNANKIVCTRGKQSLIDARQFPFCEGPRYLVHYQIVILCCVVPKPTRDRSCRARQSRETILASHESTFRLFPGARRAKGAQTTVRRADWRDHAGNRAISWLEPNGPGKSPG